MRERVWARLVGAAHEEFCAGDGEGVLFRRTTLGVEARKTEAVSWLMTLDMEEKELARGSFSRDLRVKYPTPSRSCDDVLRGLRGGTSKLS